MKTTLFQGKKIIPANQPIPKPNQIWQSERGELIIVTSVQKENKEVVFVYCEHENGDKFGMGCGWFNGREYTYVGYIL